MLPSVAFPTSVRMQSREARPRSGRGIHIKFLSAFRAMQMRPASLESHCSTGKRPGLIEMSGAMALKNLMWIPRPLLGCASRNCILTEVGNATIAQLCRIIQPLLTFKAFFSIFIWKKHRSRSRALQGPRCEDAAKPGCEVCGSCPSGNIKDSHGCGIS